MSMRLLAGLVLASSVAFPSCTLPYARVYGGYIQTDLTGDVGLGAGAGPVAGTVDVEDDLALDESGSPYVRAEIGTPIASVTASAFKHTSSGTGTLPAAFGAVGAGGTVSTNTEFVQAKIAATWNLFDLSVLRVSPGIALDYFDIDMRVNEQQAPFRVETVDARAPIPMGFLQLESELGPIAATVEAGGMAADLNDVDGTYWDVEALLRYQVTDLIEIFAGYRFISIDAEGEADGQNFDTDLVLSGWMVGGGLVW